MINSYACFANEGCPASRASVDYLAVGDDERGYESQKEWEEATKSA